MTDKTVVLVTGGNQGIGFQTVRLLVESNTPYHVLLGSRVLSNGEKAIAELSSVISDSKSTVTAVQLDITDQSSISAAVASVSTRYKRLDILINNAAISVDNKSGVRPLAEILRMAFETNVIGNGAVTDNFIPLLRQSTSGKIIFLTSGLGSFTQATDPSNGFYNLDAFSYRASKAALNMLMVEWARVLGKDGIKVWGVCPGFCATNLSGDAEAAKEMGGKDPSLGALVVLDVVEGRRERDVGRVVFDTGVRPW